MTNDKNISKPNKSMENKSKQKKNKKKPIVLLVLIIAVAALLLYIYPENKSATINASANLLKELIMILPAVMVLMGLFTVWISNETVVKYMGHASGFTGLLLSLLLGMMPTGPLYAAFPMASMLLKKGARVANIIIFLSAWACIKFAQELVELRFMGFKFMIIRLSLTVVMVVIMGFLIEKLDRVSNKLHKEA